MPTEINWRTNTARLQVLHDLIICYTEKFIYNINIFKQYQISCRKEVATKLIFVSNLRGKINAIFEGIQFSDSAIVRM